MSCEILFRPTAEAMAKYKPQFGGTMNKDYIKELRLGLLVYCLQPHDPKDRDDNTVFQLRSRVQYLAQRYRQDQRERVYADYQSDAGGEVWFRARDRYDDEEAESLLLSCVEDLLVLATVVPTPDYFDDGERFCDKRNAIMESIDSIEETAREAEIARICEELAPFEVKDDLEADDAI